MIAAGTRIRFAGGAALALAALALQAGPVPAQDRLSPSSREVATMAGPWEAASESHPRKCRILLNGAREGEERLVVGMPPACRMALPGLVAVAQWALTADRKIKLLAADGREIATFEGGSGGSFRSAIGDEGIVLNPIGARYAARERNQAVRTVVAPAQPPPPEDGRLAPLTGRYVLAREAGGSAICALTLSLDLTSKPDMRKAGLESTCDDRGLLIFDPVGWRYENERLFLVARKGHSIGFQSERDGVWRKEPAQGRPLQLRKE